MTKKRHPTVFDAQLLRNPLEYLHQPYTAWKYTPWATFLAVVVCVYLLSNFRGGLRKTHNGRRAVRFDPSRSSEVDHFRVIWKGLCDFLLVINSNLSSISHRFSDTTTYRLKIANFPYPTSVQPQIWKRSLCTRSLKFCVRRASYDGNTVPCWAN